MRLAWNVIVSTTTDIGVGYDTPFILEGGKSVLNQVLTRMKMVLKSESESREDETVLHEHGTHQYTSRMPRLTSCDTFASNNADRS